MASREQPISPVTNKRPPFRIDTASINIEPVELESTPISPERLRERDPKSAEQVPENQKLRETLMQDRKVNPAVLVDIPDLPDADQLAQVNTTATKRADPGTPIKDALR